MMAVANDKAAKLTEFQSSIVRENYKLAHFVLLKKLRVKRSDYRYDDAASVAYVVLCQCARLWDKNRGVKFSTYAVFVLRKALSKWLREQSLSGMSPKAAAMEDLPRTCSLSYLKEEVVEKCLIDYRPSESEIYDTREYLAHFISKLDARKKRVLICRYYESIGIEQIAKIIRTSRCTCAKIHIDAIQELAKLMYKDKT